MGRCSDGARTVNPFPVVGILAAVLAGICVSIAVDAKYRGLSRSKWLGRIMALVFLGLALALVYVPPAHARDVMEIPNIGVVLTDERGTCPKDHAIAKFDDLTRGCWTIGEHDRITRIYKSGTLFAEFSSLRLEIYARRVN